MNNLISLIQEVLRDKRNAGVSLHDLLPDIRYFNGLDVVGGTPFCTAGGMYAAETLEDSIKLFLKELNSKNNED